MVQIGLRTIVLDDRIGECDFFTEGPLGVDLREGDIGSDRI